MAPLTISSFRDWLRKRYGQHGQGHVFYAKDDPLMPDALSCVVPAWSTISERAIPGLLQPVINIDCLGQLHGVPYVGAFPVVVGPDGEGPRKLYLRYHIRYTANDEEVDSLLLAADPNNRLWIGRILVDTWPEAGRGDYQVYVKDGATRFPFSSDAKLNSQLDLKKNFEHNFNPPIEFDNLALYVRTAGDGVTGNTIFDVFVYSETDVGATYIIA